MSNELEALRQKAETAALTDEERRHALHNIHERRAELHAQFLAFDLETQQIDAIEAGHQAALAKSREQ